MPEEAEDPDTVSRPPLFQNRSQGVTLWADEDKNGNMFLRVSLPLNLGNVSVFVNESGFKALRDEFNQFVDNLEKDE